MKSSAKFPILRIILTAVIGYKLVKNISLYLSFYAMVNFNDPFQANLFKEVTVFSIPLIIIGIIFICFLWLFPFQFPENKAVSTSSQKTLLVLLVLTFLAGPVYAGNHGQVAWDSFKPIEKYEKDFQDTIAKSPKLFALIIATVFHTLSHDEFMRMFAYVEEDLVMNKVDPRLSRSVFRHAMYWEFLNGLDPSERQQEPVKKELEKMGNEVDQ